MEVFLADTGDLTAAPVRVTKRHFVIGRGDDCDLTLPCRLVSRHHAEIRRRGDGVYVRDLDSRNGTLLNGERIVVEVPLQYGDVVAFATESYVVRMAASDGRRRAQTDSGCQAVP
jgi:pSer/pThr/pTyr-binding forkhead associated (FHA) protein